MAKALFFETKRFGMEEAPDRLRVQLNAVCHKFLPQLPYRLVRPRGNQSMGQIPVQLNTMALMRAILARCGRAGLPLTLTPADHRRNQNTEPGRHHATAVVNSKRRNNTLV